MTACDCTAGYIAMLCGLCLIVALGVAFFLITGAVGLLLKGYIFLKGVVPWK